MKQADLVKVFGVSAISIKLAVKLYEAAGPVGFWRPRPTRGPSVLTPLAFEGCTSLTGVYFEGNAPVADAYVSFDAGSVTVYYLPGTMGWGATFADRTATLWNPEVPKGDGNFGVRGGQFGFTITGSSGLVIVVEACTDLGKPIWTPVGTNTLTAGSSFFSDPKWTDYPTRLYRLRSP